MLESGRAAQEGERRRSPRRERTLEFTLLDENERVLDGEALLRDLSDAGLGFHTAAALRPGDPLRFRMRLPGLGAVAGKARACWTRADGAGFVQVCGARIESMGWRHSRRLRRFLRPRPGGPLALFDALLAAGCCLAAFLALQELRDSHPELAARAAAVALDWLPQALVIGGALLGLALLLPR